MEPGANYAGFTATPGLTPGVNAFTDLQAAINQSAVDYGSSGFADTIEVAPGTYTNDYTISAPVSLVGSNIYYNSSTPITPAPASYNTADPEATVIQAPASPSPGGAAYNDTFRILSSGVSVRGFLINGNSTADDGISNLNNSGNTVQVNNVTIQNNIIQNFTKATGFGSTGIYLDNADPGTSGPDSSKVSTGITIAHNFFAHAGAAPSGNTDGAINLADNLIATVNANTINVNADNHATSVGIEVGNYNTSGVAGTTTMLITNNYITVGQDAAGIFLSTFGQSANHVAVNITGNNIQAASGVTPSGLQSTYATSLHGIQAGAVVTEQDNIGTSGGQFDRGIDVWNDSSGTVVIYYSTVGASTFASSPVIGVDVHDQDVYSGSSVGPVAAAITGSSINGVKYGIDVEATNVAVCVNIGHAAGPTFVNGIGTGAVAGVGIELNGIGATASASNSTANNASTVTGESAAVQTSGSTSTTGLTKAFQVTGADSGGNYDNISVSNSGAVTATASTGSAGSLTVTAQSGDRGIGFAVFPALPAGVSIVNGTLTWGAGVLTVGTHTLVFAQSSTPVLYQTITFVVDAPPTISAPAAATAHAGTSGFFTVTKSGSPSPTLSMLELSGPPLPSGVTFNATSGTFTWPSYLNALNYGVYVLQFTATNAIGSVSTTVTWTVGP